MQKELAARRAARGEAGGETGGTSAGAPRPGPTNGAGGSGRNGGQAGNGASGSRPQPTMLYFVKDGKLAMMPVRTGITDGQSTEVRGPLVEEGAQVIAGMTQAAQSTSSNPFQSTQSSSPPRPPGMF
jgi:HlyD family secretion protein